MKGVIEQAIDMLIKQESPEDEKFMKAYGDKRDKEYMARLRKENPKLSKRHPEKKKLEKEPNDM